MAPMTTTAAQNKLWRETPLIESTALSKAAGCRIFLKLENLQPSGSFKSRGIGNYISSYLCRHPENTSPHFYSSSGGNAGLACVVAAVELGLPATVVVPMSTKPLMIAKIRAAGAHEVIQHGATWKEADAYMREVLLAEDKNGVHVPPFDHEDIWHGNSTLVEEVKEQLNHSRSPVSRSEGIKPTGAMTNGYSTSRREIVPDAIICSVGGGGLFAGIMEALSRNPTWSHVPVIAVETQGAASLHSSLKAKSLITLPSITSLATSLGASRVAEKAFEYAQQPNVRSVMLSDAEAAMGCWRIADDERMMVELACGVSAALCYGGRLEKALGKKLTGDEVIVVVLCGGNNVTVDMLARFREEYAYVEKMEKISGEVPSEYSRPAKA